MAVNIQRGRDHGLPDYNTARKAYGLTAKEKFIDIKASNSYIPDSVRAREEDRFIGICRCSFSVMIFFGFF